MEENEKVKSETSTQGTQPTGKTSKKIVGKKSSGKAVSLWKKFTAFVSGHKALTAVVATVVLATVVAVPVAVTLTKSHDNPVDENTTDDITNHEHTFATEWSSDDDYHWLEATCGHNVTDAKAAHTYVVDEASSVVATCSTEGKNVLKCSDCGKTKEVTVPTLAHVWGDASVVEATCTEAGYSVVKCTNPGCSATQKSNFVNALGHDFSAPTCCDNAVCQREDCGVKGEPALGHKYMLESSLSTAPGCETVGKNVYVCQNGGCNEQYEEEVAAVGHMMAWVETLNFVKQGETTEVNLNGLDATDKCGYMVKEGGCESCGYTEKIAVSVVDHRYKSEIVTVATCSTQGTKKYTCENCSYVKNENYSDPDAHAWDAGVENAGIKTYTCTHNGEHTKTAVVYTENSATIPSDTVKGVSEVNLNGTAIAFDSAAKESLSGDVKLAADTLTGQDLEDALTALGSDSPVKNGKLYDISLTDNDDNKIEFGGSVTVTVPYVLGEGEDPDDITVSYIDGDKISEVKGKYTNGYVVFETTHFSYYTVTKMSPAERCKIYGHSMTVVHIDPTCLISGHDVKFCTRCGYSVKEDIDPLGHEWKETVISERTCTTDGVIEKKCSRCSAKYTIKDPASGHEYDVNVDRAATCTEAGKKTYTCGVCGDHYETTVPQKAHAFVANVVPATCTAGGYTINTCSSCGLQNQTNAVPALGHSLKYVDVLPTCTTDGYTYAMCSTCGLRIGENTNITSKLGHKIVDGVCTRCGEGCNHNFVKDKDVPATCTADGYTLYKCSSCGKENKNNEIKALGHSFNADECTRCHVANPDKYNFYTNMIPTSIAGAFTIKGVNVDVSYGYVSEYESWGFNAKQMGITEMTFSISDAGDILACGKGNMRIDFDEGDEDVTVAAEFYVKDGRIYIFLDSDNQETVPKYAGYIDIDFILGAMGTSFNYETLKQVISWMNTDLKNIFDSIIRTNQKTIAEGIKAFLDKFFTVEAKDGKYTYVLKCSAISDLHRGLYEKPLSDVITDLFGEGTVDALYTLIDSAIDMQIEDVISAIEDIGLYKDQVCTAANNLMCILGMSDFDLNEMYDQMLETYKGMTVEEIIKDVIGEEEDVDIKEAIEEYKVEVEKILAKSLYDVIFGSDDDEDNDEGDGEIIEKAAYDEAADEKKEIFDMINNIISMIFDKSSFSFTVNTKGQFVGMNINADVAIYYNEGDVSSVEPDEYDFGIIAKGTITIDANGKVVIDENKLNASGKQAFTKNKQYTTEIAEFENFAQIPGLFSRKKGTNTIVYTDSKGNIKQIVKTEENISRYISYGSSAYYYIQESVNNQVYSYTPAEGELYMNISEYCGSISQLFLDMKVERTYDYYYRELVVSRNTGKVVRTGENSRKENNVNSNTYNTSVTLYYDTKADEFLAEDPHGTSTSSKLELDEENSKIECHGYRTYKCSNCGETVTKSISHMIYDESWTGGDNWDDQYSEEVQLLPGSVTCEDGVMYKQYYKCCGELNYSETTKNHRTVSQEINLKEYGSTCDDTITISTCACGKELYFNVNQLTDNEKLGYNYDRDSYVYNYNGKTYEVCGWDEGIYSCPVTGCNFVLAYLSYVKEPTKENNCLYQEYSIIVLGVTVNGEELSGGKVLGPYLTSSYTSHNWIDEYKYIEAIGKEADAHYCSLCGRCSYASLTNIEKDNQDRETLRTEEYWYFNDDGTVSSYNMTKYESTYGEIGITEFVITYTDNYINQTKYTFGYVEVEGYYGNAVSAGDRSHRAPYGYYIYLTGEERTYREGNSYKKVYSYDNGCYCSPEYTAQYSDGRTESGIGSTNHVVLDMVGERTCTQCIYGLCYFCEEQVLISSHPQEHYFVRMEGSEYYVCKYCGLQNDKDYDGNISLEDLSYTSDGNYVIGYYSTIGDMFTVTVSLVSNNESKIIGSTNPYIEGSLTITLFEAMSDYDYDEKEYWGEFYALWSGTVSFSIADVARIAEEMGLNDYEICVTYSPESNGSTLDYSITLDVHNWYVIKGVDKDGEQAEIEYCTNCTANDIYGNEYVYVKGKGYATFVDNTNDKRVTITITRTNEEIVLYYQD